MYPKSKILQVIKILGAVAITSALIVFSELRQSERTCKDLYVEMKDKSGDYFVSEHEVENLITQEGQKPIAGTALADISLKDLENTVRENSFVNRAAVFRTVSGEVGTEIEQEQPIARLITETKQGYLSRDGRVLPLSDKYSARVMIVEGDSLAHWMKSDFLKSENAKALLNFIKFVTQNKFGSALIPYITVDRNNDIALYPTVGVRRIDFGRPDEETEEKWKKLMLFYEKILPLKGPGTYGRVSVEFKDQIVCE